MNTWTCRLFGILAACVALSGCLGETEANLIGQASEPGRPSAPAVRGIALVDGAIKVQAPQGYCVDDGSSRDRRKGAFVLMAACASVTGDPQADMPLDMGFVTVSVGQAGSGVDLGPMQGVADFFVSPAGRALLSRDGAAETVEIRSSRISQGAVLLATRDSSENRPPEVGTQVWRAVFPLQDRLVTVGVLSLNDAPIDDFAGFDLALGVVNQMRAANLEAVVGVADLSGGN